MNCYYYYLHHSLPTAMAATIIRYGTTTFIMAPYKVLHVELIGYDSAKLRQSVEGKDKADLPYAIVVPRDFVDPSKTKQLLIDSGLWFI